MEDKWIKTPPKPVNAELRRTVSTEPVKIVLVYAEGTSERATVVLSKGCDVVVLTEIGTPQVPSGRAVFEALAATLDHFETAFRHAAIELREGPPPC
tara:strand:- start:1845 stop:2135 length:291 start_codon:yes stop_codon:yes gene_type:complete